MKLWVTPKGDLWLCDECQEQYKDQIKEEQWRVAFDKTDPMLRCAKCKQCDIEIID